MLEMLLGFMDAKEHSADDVRVRAAVVAALLGQEFETQCETLFCEAEEVGTASSDVKDWLTQGAQEVVKEFSNIKEELAAAGAAWNDGENLSPAWASLCDRLLAFATPVADEEPPSENLQAHARALEKQLRGRAKRAARREALQGFARVAEEAPRESVEVAPKAGMEDTNIVLAPALKTRFAKYELLTLEEFQADVKKHAMTVVKVMCVPFGPRVFETSKGGKLTKGTVLVSSRAGLVMPMSIVGDRAVSMINLLKTLKAQAR